MKCPACSGELKSESLGSVSADFCKGGCGGLWLDANELGQLHDTNGSIDRSAFLHRNKDVVVNQSKVRRCPKCANQPLTSHFHDGQRQVEVDECLGCGGIWLDLGELGQIHNQDKVTQFRQQVVDQYNAKYRDAIDRGETPKRVAAVFKLLFS